MRSCESAFYDADWLIAIAPQLPADLLSEILDRSIAVSLHDSRNDALDALAPVLPRLLVERCLTATGVRDDVVRAQALSSLALSLQENDRRLLQGIALDAALAAPESHRLAAMNQLLPSLDPTLLPRAVAACRSLDVYQKADAFDLLSRGQAPIEQHALALEGTRAAREIKDPLHRAMRLVRLVERLPGDERVAVTQETFDAIEEITDSFPESVRDRRAELMTALALVAPPERKEEIFDLALANASANAVDWRTSSFHAQSAAEYLATLAGLDSDKTFDALRNAFRAALKASYGGHKAVAALAPALPPRLLHEAAAVIARAKERDYEPANLAAMIPCLAREERQAFALKALEGARNRPYEAAFTLTTIAPYLPPGNLPSAATIAMYVASNSIQFNADRIEAMASISARLPVSQQEPAFAEVAREIAARYSQSHISSWAKIAPFLPSHLITAALTLIPRSGSATNSGAHAAIAVFRRAAEIPPEDKPPPYEQLLRAGLAGFGRAGCLEVINATAHKIAETGGDAAVKACADSIRNVGRWWP